MSFKIFLTKAGSLVPVAFPKYQLCCSCGNTAAALFSDSWKVIWHLKYSRICSIPELCYWKSHCKCEITVFCFKLQHLQTLSPNSIWCRGGRRQSRGHLLLGKIRSSHSLSSCFFLSHIFTKGSHQGKKRKKELEKKKQQQKNIDPKAKAVISWFFQY